MIEASARGAWRELESRLRPFVARRVTAEADVDDVVQDVFVRMLRGLDRLRHEERFGPWVYQVARSAIIDHRRAAARRAAAGEGAGEAAAPGADEDDRAAERSLAGAVAVFVAALPPPYREALTLTELQGMTQQEAADRSGVSLSGMKSRVQRGRQRLRRALEDCCHIALDARGRVESCARRADGGRPSRCCEEPSRSAGATGAAAAA